MAQMANHDPESIMFNWMPFMKKMERRRKRRSAYWRTLCPDGRVVWQTGKMIKLFCCATLLPPFLYKFKAIWGTCLGRTYAVNMLPVEGSLISLSSVRKWHKGQVCYRSVQDSFSLCLLRTGNNSELSHLSRLAALFIIILGEKVFMLSIDYTSLLYIPGQILFLISPPSDTPPPLYIMRRRLKQQCLILRYTAIFMSNIKSKKNNVPYSA